MSSNVRGSSLFRVYPGDHNLLINQHLGNQHISMYNISVPAEQQQQGRGAVWPSYHFILKKKCTSIYFYSSAHATVYWPIWISLSIFMLGDLKWPLCPSTGKNSVF